jgi:cell wall assembly regulator SMI1
VRKSLRPPAKPEAIGKLQAALGVTVPSDFVASVARHNGQSEEAESGLFPHSDVLGPEPAWRLLSLAEIQSAWVLMKGLIESGEFAGRPSTPPAGVCSDWWHPGWVPVAQNGGGDLVCLDTAPAEGGHAGQVLLFSHDDAVRPILAPSFDVWLTRLAEGMESGRYVYDPVEGLIEPSGEGDEDEDDDDE